jgi:hypothetical protein
LVNPAHGTADGNPVIRLFGYSVIQGEAMKNESKRKPRTKKQTSDDMFWAAASQERDPAKNLRITKLISNAIREHEGNMRRSSE